jgi:hypothetical protein
VSVSLPKRNPNDWTRGEDHPVGVGRAWVRLWWDLRHLASPAINPHIDEDNEEPGLRAKRRTGLEDVTHAAENLVREVWRSWRRR